jgi:xanthine dehydrogenase molybdenum-binding subunit
MAQAPKEFSVVGKRITRIDAYERVTGQAHYTGDIQLPGMLYARVSRSTVPHAKIISIDVSKAEKLPGVKAVIHHGALCRRSGSGRGGDRSPYR